MKPTRRIAVSGSRTITDTDFVTGVLAETVGAFIGNGDEVVLHLGDARGVDTIALDWARELGLPRIVFYADRKGWEFAEQAAGIRAWPPEDEQHVLASDWNRDGNSAGPIRNHAMIAGVCDERGYTERADMLLAITTGSPGTRNAVATARNQYIRSVVHHYPDGSVVVSDNTRQSVGAIV